MIVYDFEFESMMWSVLQTERIQEYLRARQQAGWELLSCAPGNRGDWVLLTWRKAPQ